MFRRGVSGFAILLLGTPASALPAFSAYTAQPELASAAKQDLHLIAVVHKSSKWTKSPKAKPVPSAASQNQQSSQSPTQASDEKGSKLQQGQSSDAKAQQTQARQMQEAALKAQQSQARHAEETQRLFQEQAKQSQEVARIQQAKQHDIEEAALIQKEALRKAHQREVLQMQAEEEKAGQKAKVEEAKVDEAEQEFKKTQAATLTASFSGARKISDRNALPALTSKPLPVQKAAPQPFLIRSPSGGERHQAQLFQQNLQSRLTPVPASDAPSTYTELKATQTKNYFNNYPAYVNHQAITINKKNTYIREVPPTQYPAWYERTPGWTYCNSYILGSNVQVNSEFFGLDWPAFYGPAPEGFICQPDFFPTPWIYFPYCDKWRMSGALAFGQGPDADYTGPITVETMEPVTAKIPDKFGVPVFQTINVLDFYNAFYYPEIERWGYMNKQGNFVWLNI